MWDLYRRPQRGSERTRPVVALFTGFILLAWSGVAAAQSLTGPTVNFPGITSFSNPPDTVGDVGPNHYVQMVNATFYQIWDKSGNSLFGPATFGLLWPVGDICRSSTGDPIVVYDHLADRWLLSQFAFPSHMCIAISQTPDPTAGTWFTYTFNVGSFPDYPKFGVWPDGYYMSTFEFPNLGIYVFDRNSMLTGAAGGGFQKTTISVLFGTAPRVTRILPADLDGPAPAAGTPNFFVRSVDDQQDLGDPTDRIEVYEARVNWVAPSFTFTLVDTLTPSAFDVMLCNRNFRGIRDCIPQPDTVDTIDALSNRPMMQVKYRNLGTYASMVFNQTIDVRNLVNSMLGFLPTQEVAGVRWYELRKTSGGSNWAIQDEGTFADQPAGATTEAELLHRWMGSAAIDSAGNIAVGYSIVNSDSTNGNEVYPGIRYTGRTVNDPAGTMPQGEMVITNGVNPQGDADSFVEPQRWGDYSALSVDPDDDCTLWYTNHVAGIGGTGPRPSSIASFEFSTCENTPPVASCIESVNPSGKNVPPAGSTTLPGSKGGENEDGFYELVGEDEQDGTAPVFVTNASGSATFGPFASGSVVKVTEAPGATPTAKGIGGPNSSVAAHITLDSDAFVFAEDSAGEQSAVVSCLVPPPPK